MEVKMLTGKAKEDFQEFMRSKTEVGRVNSMFNEDFEPKDDFETELIKAIKQSTAIMWLDNVDLHVYTEYYNREWFAYITGKNGVGSYSIEHNSFPDRQSATKAAIEQANKIYNER